MLVALDVAVRFMLVSFPPENSITHLAFLVVK